MTNEEAIKKIKQFGLYHAIEDLPNSVLTVQAFNMAIEALEKQIPKKPKPHEDDEYSAKCPNCYDEVDTHWVHGGISYCPFCGQAIDWSDDDD